MQGARRYVGTSLLALAAVAATLAALAGTGHPSWLIACVVVAVVTVAAGVATMVPDLLALTGRRKSSAPPQEIGAVQAQRSEIKAAIASYLEVAQHLQTQLYAREHGREVGDIPVMVEQLWLAHAKVEILCSKELRETLTQHANALNEVARHGDHYDDWWSYVEPYVRALTDSIRKELKRPDTAPAVELCWPMQAKSNFADPTKPL